MKQISEAPRSIIQIITSRKLRSIVEVGVYRSSFCKQVLSVIGEKLSSYWLVDPWGIENCTDSSGGSFSKSQWEDAYFNACRLMFEYDCVKVLRMTSLKSVKLFEHKSVDLVYIDGSHEFVDVCNDIKAWKPKIKNDGVISGHDFGAGWPEVKRAVESCFKSNAIQLHLGTVWSVKI